MKQAHPVTGQALTPRMVPKGEPQVEQEELDDLRLMLAQAVDLLERSRDYLLRLPQVHPTRQMIKSIEEHLQDPGPRYAKAGALRRGRSLQTLQVGSAFTASGVEAFRVEVNVQESVGSCFLASPQRNEGVSPRQIQDVVQALQSEGGLKLRLSAPQPWNFLTLGSC